MKNMKRILSILIVLALMLAFGATLAYFTDRIDGNGSITTADNALDIEIDPIVPTPEDPEDDESDTEDETDPDFPSDPGEASLGDWWADINATALGNFNPGDKLCLDGEITNSGTLNLEYRETFVVTCSKAMDADDPEFRLFIKSQRESYGAITGLIAVPFTPSADYKTFTYVIGPKDLASGAGLTTNYDLVFNKLASNDYQGVTITVDYILEACQDGADWDVIATATVSTSAGDRAVVPDADS